MPLRDNEPMISVHLRIPSDLMEKVGNASQIAGVTKSEFIRLCVEYVFSERVELVTTRFIKRD